MEWNYWVIWIRDEHSKNHTNCIIVNVWHELTSETSRKLQFFAIQKLSSCFSVFDSPCPIFISASITFFDVSPLTLSLSCLSICTCGNIKFHCICEWTDIFRNVSMMMTMTIIVFFGLWVRAIWGWVKFVDDFNLLSIIVAWVCGADIGGQQCVIVSLEFFRILCNCYYCYRLSLHLNLFTQTSHVDGVVMWENFVGSWSPRFFVRYYWSWKCAELNFDLTEHRYRNCKYLQYFSWK